MLLGTGLAFYWGKPDSPRHLTARPGPGPMGAICLPCAQRCKSTHRCPWVLLALVMSWPLVSTRWGWWCAHGGDRRKQRALATSGAIGASPPMAGGAIAGLGGACLTLFYPGSWNEGISSGQGLTAVALVILRAGAQRRCLLAARCLGRRARWPRAAITVAGWGYHLFNTGALR